LKIESLQSIIDNTEFHLEKQSENSLKKVLKKTIQELYNYNEVVLEGIKEKVLFPQKEFAIGEIACALIPKEQNINLSPLPLQNEALLKDIIFIDADYEEMRYIVGDDETEKFYEGFYWINGKKEKFYYKFQFKNVFLEAQKLLFQLDKYYNIDNPILFSPFCQKAFCIIYKDEIPQETERIEYYFKEQSIPVVEDNSTLFWNLSVKKTDIISYTVKTPYDSKEKYKYIIEKPEKNWYYILPQNNHTLIYDIQFTEKGTEIWLDHDLESFILVEWNDMDWEQTEIKKFQKRIFSNKLKKNHFTKRIHSLGDIEHALLPFRNNMNIVCSTTEKLDKIYLRYSAKYKNHFQKISYNHLKRVYLKFQAKEFFPYIEDYVNYVLSYLEYQYPEIEWVGGE